MQTGPHSDEDLFTYGRKRWIPRFDAEVEVEIALLFYVDAERKHFDCMLAHILCQTTLPCNLGDTLTLTEAGFKILRVYNISNLDRLQAQSESPALLSYASCSQG